MSDERTVSAAEVGESLIEAVKELAKPKVQKEAVFYRHLREHFEGGDPATLPILREAYKNVDHPNIQVALDAFLGEPGRAHRLFGLNSAHLDFDDIGLSDLVVKVEDGSRYEIVEGPVALRRLAVEADRHRTCIHAGLFLVEGEERLAVLVIGPDEERMQRNVRIEVMAAEVEAAERFLERLRALVRERSVYRGQVLSLDTDSRGRETVRFARLRAVARDDIILPEGLLERVERHSKSFSRHAERLRAAGRHLKRGVLLYGPPGTGKTMTAMHLAQCEPGRTVFLLTGHGVGLLSETCAMARLLQPATVIIEDVDLIAEERSGDCRSGFLFELLNQMDGLSEDVDVLFLLTTNRPDVIEPAIASRPGRVDEAIEVPRPDAACRARLFALYSEGMRLELADLGTYIDRTEGVSAAFIRELLRKAALYAAEKGEGAIVVGDLELERALKDLALNGNALTRSFLGFTESTRGV